MQKKCIVFIHAKGFVPWERRRRVSSTATALSSQSDLKYFLPKSLKYLLYIDCVEKNVMQSVNHPASKNFYIFLHLLYFYSLVTLKVKINQRSCCARSFYVNSTLSSFERINSWVRTDWSSIRERLRSRKDQH